MAKGLFFGFFIDSFYKKSLQEVADPLKKLYIQEEAGSYLQLFQFQEKSYLGKFLDDQVDLRSLELTYHHLLSLLKQLVPNYPYCEEKMVLFTVFH